MRKIATNRGVAVSIGVLFILLATNTVTTLPWPFWAAWLLLTAYLAAVALNPVHRD